MMQASKKWIYIAAFFSSLTSTARSQGVDVQQFNLGIINNTAHTLIYRGVSQSAGTTCSTFEGNKLIHPGDGFVVTESMSGANLLACLYKFKTELGDAIQLQVINPTYFYQSVPSYGFFDAELHPLSTTYTPEKYPILPRNLMHKSAIISLNPF